MSDSPKGFSPTRLRRLHDAMTARVEREIPGLVMALWRHGETSIDAIGVQDRDTGAPARPDTIFRIASLPKPITAAAAMTLIEEGRHRRLTGSQDRRSGPTGDVRTMDPA